MPDSNPRNGLSYLVLTSMIDSYNPTQGKLKNREFSRVWYALVAMDVTYAIVKAYVTERNDIIEHHSNVITIRRMLAVAVTALL